MESLRIIARGWIYTSAAVSLLIVVQSARGEVCYEETIAPAPKSSVAQPTPRPKSARVFGKRKAEIKADATRINALARRPAAGVTLREVPCARPSDFKPAPLGPVVPYLWEQPFVFDSSTDYFAQYVGPAPAPRASVPVAGTLPLFILGAAVAWRQRRV